MRERSIAAPRRDAAADGLTRWEARHAVTAPQRDATAGGPTREDAQHA